MFFCCQLASACKTHGSAPVADRIIYGIIIGAKLRLLGTCSCAIRTWRWSVGELAMSCNSCRWFILDQTGSLQGTLCVSRCFLAANVPGIGSGWQQSKQNWTLLAVVGYWIRMACSDLFCAEGAPLQPFFFF